MEEALVNFINEAKLAADQDSKLYALNQIRELVLHRSPALLDRGLHELAEFQVERAAQIRRFLINLYRDACEKDIRFAAMTINIFDFFSYDSNDNLIRDLINACVKLFPAIMHMFQRPREAEWAQVWEKWHQLIMRMVGFIDSDKGAQARKAAIRLLEVYAMFALKDELESVAPGDRSGSHGVTVSKLPADHPFMRAADITNEAEEALARLLIWIQRGGTRASPFDHGLYAQSIEVVCAIALRRPSYFTQIATALAHFIDRKQDLQPQIKEAAARTSAKLVVAAERTALHQDIDANLAGQKLEVALASQGFGAVMASVREAAGPGPRHVAEAQDPRKRKRDAVPQPTASSTDSKKARDEQGTAAAPVTEPTSAAAAARAPPPASALSKLGDVVMQANDWQVKPLEVDAQTYKAAGRAALLRFLSTMNTAQQQGFDQMFCSWSTKMVITMASLESTTEIGFSQTAPFRLAMSLKPASDSLEMKVTDEVENLFLAEKLQLPTSLADAADYCIDTVARNEMQGEAEGSLSSVTQLALDLLMRLFADVAQSESQNDAGWHVYDVLLAHTLTKFRTLSSIPAEVAATLLCRLPRVPRDAVELFRVSALSDAKRSREWGLRLLRDLTVFCDDISQNCLNALLWFAINSDFELRIKSVHSCHELCEEESLREHIVMFALYAVFSVTGLKLLRWRKQALGDKMAEMAELDLVEPVEQTPAQTEAALPAEGDAITEQPGQDEEQPMTIATSNGGAEQHDDQQEGPDETGATSAILPPYSYSLFNPVNLEGYTSSSTMFEGDFLTEGMFDLTGAVEVESEADVKRRIQLICNLTLLEPRMIVALRDASATVQASIDTMADEHAPALPESSDTWSKAKVEHAEAFVERQRTIAHAINSEVQNIAPAIARELGAVRLFNILANGDAAGGSLLLSVLRSLTTDDHVPPAQDLVDTVLEYVNSNAPSVDAFLVPIVGGLSAAMVEELLPRLIALGIEATEEVLRRLIRVRPPPISRAGILCALHRIDHEAQNIKFKTVRDSIELCLSNRNDFRSEVIREALEAMLQDPIPPLMFMRTVILASQAYPELRRVALRTILPRLLERKIWDTAPKVWDGFIVFVKGQAAHRDAGDLLHDLLRIPFDTLRSLVKVATTLEEPLSRIISRMGDRELEDAVTPRAPQTEEAESSASNPNTKDDNIRDKASNVRKLLGSDSRSRAR